MKLGEFGEDRAVCEVLRKLASCTDRHNNYNKKLLVGVSSSSFSLLGKLK